MAVDTARIAADADWIYRQVYEHHYAMSLEAVSALGRDWQPPARAAAATASLITDRLAVIRTVNGRRMLFLADAVEASSTR